MPALRQVWAMPHCLLVLPRVPALPPCCPRRFINNHSGWPLAPQRIKLSGPKLYTLKFRLENRPWFNYASLCHVASVIVPPASSMPCCRHSRPSLTIPLFWSQLLLASMWDGGVMLDGLVITPPSFLQRCWMPMASADLKYLQEACVIVQGKSTG